MPTNLEVMTQKDSFCNHLLPQKTVNSQWDFCPGYIFKEKMDRS